MRRKLADQESGWMLWMRSWLHLLRTDSWVSQWIVRLRTWSQFQLVGIWNLFVHRWNLITWNWNKRIRQCFWFQSMSPSTLLVPKITGAQLGGKIHWIQRIVPNWHAWRMTEFVMNYEQIGYSSWKQRILIQVRYVIQWLTCQQWIATNGKFWSSSVAFFRGRTWNFLNLYYVTLFNLTNFDYIWLHYTTLTYFDHLWPIMYTFPCFRSCWFIFCRAHKGHRDWVPDSVPRKPRRYPKV